MTWLITQSAGWLLLTMLFAGIAGWMWAAERAASGSRALRRQREHLLRDLSRLGGGEAPDDRLEREREVEGHRRQIEIREGRIAELERLLEAARARAEEAASRLAALERNDAPALTHQIAVSVVDATSSEPAKPEEQALQAWRLRYFEQRVRYLESAKPAPAAAAPPPTVADVSAAPPTMEWRAREAEARAAHLEDEVRAAMARAQGRADAAREAEALSAWRMHYLERRAAHLQTRAALNVAPPEQGPDPEIWKWRARYLEARLRQLQQTPATVESVVPAPEPETPAPAAAPPAPVVRGVKPPVLSAPRNGLPDDFTLIDGLSAMQQSTLNALGIFHFDQIAAWTPEHVAWVDRYLYLRGRIGDEEWVEQADDLARGGVSASRRMLAEENA
jgi:predicted flap endonuclease-1-like 5' DNA nuclease